MKLLKINLILLAVLCCFWSCNGKEAAKEDIPEVEVPEEKFLEEGIIEENTIEEDAIGEIPFSVIAQYFQWASAITKAYGYKNVNFVITNNTDWNYLLNKKIVRSSETDIDFSEYRIIAVFDRVHGNGGWSIDITKILEFSDKIVVFVCNLETGNATSVITDPYHIVKIPYSEKRVMFNVKLTNDPALQQVAGR